MENLYSVISCFSFLSPWTTRNIHLYLRIYLFWIFHIERIIHIVIFYTVILLLGIMFRLFIHGIACISTPCFVCVKITHHNYLSPFVYPFTCWCTVGQSLHLLNIKNGAAMDTEVHELFQYQFSVLLDVYLGVHIAVAFFSSYIQVIHFKNLLIQPMKHSLLQLNLFPPSSAQLLGKAALYFLPSFTHFTFPSTPFHSCICLYFAPTYILLESLAVPVSY